MCRVLPLAINVAVLIGLAGCDDSPLRGKIAASPDGKTYLVLADDQNGCAISLDGKSWPVPNGARYSVSPGRHVIACHDSEIEFDIPEGVVFTFDYWGP